MLDARSRRLLDVIMVAWTAIWILVAITVYHEVRGLRSLADTVTVAGLSLRNTADTLDAYSSVPLVGKSLGNVADDARRTAVSARRSAREGRRSVDHLAVLLSVAVAAVAIGPLALAYALLRFHR